MKVAIAASLIFLLVGCARTQNTSQETLDLNRLDLPAGTFTVRETCRKWDNWLFVDVYLNQRSQPLQFVLDTGAAYTLIDDDIPERCRLEDTHTSIESMDMGGNVQTGRIVEIDELRIGGLTVTNLYGFVSSLAEMEQSLGMEIDGFIGGNFFRQLTTAFDYQAAEVVFSNDPGFSSTLPADTFSCPLIQTNNVPNINISFANGYSELCVLDTGCDALFMISSSSLALSGLSNQPALICDGIFGYNASSPAAAGALYRIQDLRLGPLMVEELDVSCQGNGTLTNFLGSSFFSNFLLVIDFPSRRVAFVPKNDNYMRMHIRSTGIASYTPNDDGVIISGLWRDSPAVEAGLRLGDLILAVNGTDLRSFDIQAIDDLVDLTIDTSALFRVSQEGVIRDVNLEIRSLLE